MNETTKANDCRTATAALARVLRHAMILAVCTALLAATAPLPVQAQDTPASDEPTPLNYTVEQLDALLAPIALYPDTLLTQILMASVYPLQIVAAARWLENAGNKALTGEALDKALANESWDPSVKSLVPFPQVIEQMNGNLDWTQQLGYAMTEQQSDVMESVQRLRAQAQASGQLKTSEQQAVSNEGQTIIIVPAQPNIVYVPAYNPTIVYGAWPYAAYPPVYFPPPPGYVVGSAIAFGVGVAVTASLWGWARPNWGYGNVNVNVNRYNNINVNRPPIHNPNWRAGGPGYRPPAGGLRPPAGPVGRPGRPGGFPANGIGRPSVSVPGNVTRPPAGMGPGANRPPIGQGGNKLPGNGGNNNRPGGGAKPGNPLPANPGGNNRPGGGQFQPGQANKPATRPAPAPAARQKPAARPAAGQGNGNRGPAAFNGMNQGKAAGQFQNRGAQSRQVRAPHGGGGVRAGGGGARPGGGHGGGRLRQ